MGLQKYRADEADAPDPNGAVAWHARWMGGLTLALVRNCPTPFGPRTVYTSGEPDTFFSIPARCQVKGKCVRGYLTREHGAWQFRPYRDG